VDGESGGTLDAVGTKTGVNAISGVGATGSTSAIGDGRPPVVANDGAGGGLFRATTGPTVSGNAPTRRGASSIAANPTNPPAWRTVGRCRKIRATAPTTAALRAICVDTHTPNAPNSFIGTASPPWR
jgi:hypothetical protein